MNNTIEVLEFIRKKYLVGDEWYKALTKTITTLKAVESAVGLPEKKDADWHINGSEYGRCDEYFCSDMSEGFNQAIDLLQIPYAKQILKVKELEKSISDVLTQRDMWKTDYAELQAENKKLKEQQLKLDCENNLTEDELIEIVNIPVREVFERYFGVPMNRIEGEHMDTIYFINKLVTIAIIKAREDKK